MKAIHLISLVLLTLFSSIDIHAQNFKHPHIDGPGNIEVNMCTGNLLLGRSDLFLPGVGANLDFIFTYNKTRDTIDSGFGYGWDFSYNMYYFVDTYFANI